ncbi:MAG: divalent-cation tolerance protein CutA [Acidobacteria bacterium]|nr:divalent-cation tolerance protein CutA [Acidobacteriota bacterium]
MIVVMTTVGSEEEGIRLARGLVEGRIAACVQVLPKMTSLYRWKGELQEDSEHLLLIKTVAENFAAVEEYLKANHSYDEPEIVALPASYVSDGYLQWVTESVGL